jgi:hypothetical protein
MKVEPRELQGSPESLLDSVVTCGRLGRLGNALCFQGVAVATLRVQKVLKRGWE